jgi:hypothetical protein
VRALLKDHEDAKTAVGKGVFSFCSSLKGQCAGDYETLTDEVILENALAWVAPSKDEPAAEPVAEPKAKKPVKKAVAPVAVAVAEPVAEPKAKKPVKKSVKKSKESESEE